eukprot:403367724
MNSLECLHKACLNCIETKFQRIEGGIVCYQCQGITHIEKYKQDPEVNQALSAFSLLPIICDNHPNLSADVLCLQCDVLSCKKCAKTHHEGHRLNQEKLTPEILSEYLINAAGMLEQQIFSIQELLRKINDIQENETEILSSEFMKFYKQVTTLLGSLITDKQELVKLELQKYKLIDKSQPQESGKRVEIISKVYERQLQNIQSEMYLQFINLVNLELDKVNQSLLLTAGIENYQNKNFKLLYQGSQDGFTCAQFHQKCDNQGGVVIFILSEFGQTFGGYSSISWNNSVNNWMADAQAFVFQLTKRSIHKQYQKQQNALYHDNNRLFQFGYCGDIYILNECDKNANSGCALGGTYQPPLGYQWKSNEANNYLAGQLNFKVIEVEVYQFT